MFDLTNYISLVAIVVLQMTVAIIIIPCPVYAVLVFIFALVVCTILAALKG